MCGEGSTLVMIQHMVADGDHATNGHGQEEHSEN